MITVLCPSRGRPRQLAESIRSLTDIAERPAEVEILVGLDDDDPTTDCRDLSDAAYLFPPTWVWFPQRHGYRELHRYVNGLARKARGDWLMLWNDDALMRSMAWDAYVAAHPIGVPLALNLTSESPGGMNLFPAINRAWYEAVGHVSMQAHCDTWVQDVSRAAGCERVESHVRIEHMREGDGEPEVYAVTSPEFYSERFAQMREVDVAAIRKAMVR